MLTNRIQALMKEAFESWYNYGMNFNYPAKWLNILPLGSFLFLLSRALPLLNSNKQTATSVILLKTFAVTRNNRNYISFTFNQSFEDKHTRCVKGH